MELLYSPYTVWAFFLEFESLCGHVRSGETDGYQRARCKISFRMLSSVHSKGVLLRLA